METRKNRNKYKTFKRINQSEIKQKSIFNHNFLFLIFLDMDIGLLELVENM